MIMVQYYRMVVIIHIQYYHIISTIQCRSSQFIFFVCLVKATLCIVTVSAYYLATGS